MRRVLPFLLILAWASASVVAQKAESGPYEAAMAAGDSLKAKWNHTAAAQAFEKAMQIKPDSYEAAWKAGDETTECAKNLPAGDKAGKEVAYEKARKLCERAIQLNPAGFEGHFRKAVALGRLALFRGGKQKINLAKMVKAEADTAVTLNPKADLAWHVIGRWHQDLANLNWALRAVAKVIFGGVPPGSNDEAVAAFQKAIAINPNHIEHHLELAKTYKLMGKKELMKEPLEKVLALPSVEEDDPSFKAEAKELLAKLK
jgi:tetratricopeptide (TPR) repeat protein